ncbi:protein of unknown function [Candidatus Filomicrobium marinum]|uniref:Uncharacterized protein n=1 Tax=Candidatus Filomicrobium marinum TaxID=1608628 RepID=A0A0D6JHC4_9HYPH|nr:protein of unknown function [Candidatus Filomicrobium marinum]CPR20271.1 protein of unknown function [Candidatus Filomicrobium marinum]
MTPFPVSDRLAGALRRILKVETLHIRKRGEFGSSMHRYFIAGKAAAKSGRLHAYI